MTNEIKTTIKKAMIYGTIFFVFFIIGVGLADSNLEAHTGNVFSANVPSKITVKTITPTPTPGLILPLNGGFVFRIAPELHLN
jgi:hypothetical protein